MDNEIEKPKIQLPLLKSGKQKKAAGSKTRVLCMAPAHNITKGMGKPHCAQPLDTPPTAHPT